MAVIGDVLVKLQADFAEFSRGMDESSRKLEQFGSAAQSINQKLTTAFNVLKGLGLLELVRQLQQYGENLQKQAADIGNLAQRYKLTSDQVQALQAVAKETGRSLDELATIGQKNADWLGKVTEIRKQGGGLFDAETVRQAKELSDQA